MLYYLLLTCVLASLEIRSIKNESDSFRLNYSVSNFGHIPYGQYRSGQILLPLRNQTYEFCQPNLTQENDTYTDSWMIIERGGCSFVTKVMNAQKLKVALVLIVDNLRENTQEVMMADDGKGFQVTIPSILISIEIGEEIIHKLEQGQELLGIIQFNETPRVEKPYVVFGLNIEIRETFKLLRDFRSFYDQIQNNITFEVYYEYLTCYGCRQNNFSIEISDCFGGGRYCMMDPDGNGLGNGQDIVKQQLDQFVLFQYNKTLWWDYMDQFDQKCLQPNQYSECMQSLLPADIYKAIQLNVTAGFPAGKLSTLDKHIILDQQLNRRFETGIIFYPGVTINNVTYRGNIEAVDILEDICAGSSIDILIKECGYDGDANLTEHRAEENSFYWLMIFISLTLLIFCGFMIFIFRRLVRKQMTEEMKIKIDEKVTQYIQFYEQTSKK